MTTLKTRLDEAVGTLAGDAQLLHQIVHGGDQTTVVTEGGRSKRWLTSFGKQAWSLTHPARS